jgi:hypothetical protein
MSKTRSGTSEGGSPTLPLPPPREHGHVAASQPIAIGKRIERRVPPEHATLVTVQVEPESVCFFYHPEVPERRIQLDADNRGIVRFHARALKGAAPTEFHLECHNSGQAELHTIALSADARHARSMSAPELESAPIVAGDVRPPLEGDPLAPSNAELVSRGYPPRPDPEKSAAQYSRWLKNVSRSFTKIDTRLVAHPEYSRSRGVRAPEGQAVQESGAAKPTLKAAAGSKANIDYGNWAGAQYTKPTGQFASIQADWNTPQIFALPGGPVSSTVVVWIGLDDTSGDLYQAGTGSQCLAISSTDTVFWEITSYFMWAESLPSYWWVIPNFAVSPGDQITVDIWVANQFGTTIYQVGDAGLTSQDNSVWFYLTNVTNGAVFIGTYPTAPESLGGESSTGFTGTTAEFILERPTFNGSLADLACFLPFVMTNCAYGDSQFGDYLFPLGVDNGPPALDGQLNYINMTEYGAHLALPFSVPDPNNSADAQALGFVWVNYQ